MPTTINLLDSQLRDQRIADCWDALRRLGALKPIAPATPERPIWEKQAMVEAVLEAVKAAA